MSAPTNRVVPYAHLSPRSLKPPRTLQGRARDLRLLVVLDTTRNEIALREASERGIPTVALASGQADMRTVTYPVFARDFSPAFVHFFLDALVKVANVVPEHLPGRGRGDATASQASGA
jgi:ribosomal protein S2